MPFAVAERAGILTLALDTPGSPVNILNRATAEQLVELLRAVTPATARAVVFESAKPSSFLNGVGLLLAHATRTTGDVLRASAAPWAAYRAVRECPVPTIAVVQGTCFGCGVEFALSCDRRIATDSGETGFYMTEVNDYLFIPPFGATWNLPAAVGLADAIDLLLWGARWDAATALERGLVDAVVPHAAGREAAWSAIERALAGDLPSRRRGPVAWGAEEDGVVARARRRIAALPPVYRPLYGQALELLVDGAAQRGTYLDHQRAALAGAAASALAPEGKAAYGFFYLRQMAAVRAAGRVRAPDDTLTLSLDLDAVGDSAAFMDALRRRPFPGVAFSGGEDADIRLVGPDRAARADEVVVRTGFAAGPSAERELYAPTHAAGGRLIELAGAPADDLARLARVLQRFGFEVARTEPGQTFLTTRLLLAYLMPLVRFVVSGGDGPTAAATLRDAGFVRTPDEVLAGFDRRQVVEAVAVRLGQTPERVSPSLAAVAGAHPAGARAEPVLVDALCISLAEAASRARSGGAVRDPSVVDLVARELLDFPRHLTSLCAWLKRSRVAEAVGRGARVQPLVPAQAFAAARAFATEGREFYR